MKAGLNDRLLFVENEYSKLYNEDTKRTRIHSMNGSDFIGCKNSH